MECKKLERWAESIKLFNKHYMHHVDATDANCTMLITLGNFFDCGNFLFVCVSRDEVDNVVDAFPAWFSSHSLCVWPSMPLCNVLNYETKNPKQEIINKLNSIFMTSLRRVRTPPPRDVHEAFHRLPIHCKLFALFNAAAQERKQKNHKRKSFSCSSILFALKSVQRSPLALFGSFAHEIILLFNFHLISFKLFSFGLFLAAFCFRLFFFAPFLVYEVFVCWNFFDSLFSLFS